MPTEPFIHVTGFTGHISEEWTENGFTLVEKMGSHAIFAARVPFIPSLLGADFTRMVGGSMTRPQLITRRQIRFINDLVPAKQHASTIELRFIGTPSAGAGEKGHIDLVVLGKVFDENRRQAERLARQLWEKLRTHFPLEDPFNYPLEPIGESDFAAVFEPLPWSQLTAGQIIEIRKYEDHDFLLGAHDARGYFPHPFSPIFHFSAMGRFLETLSRQQQRCVVSISIRPTALVPGELVGLTQLMDNYDRIYAESEGWVKLYREERLNDLRRTFVPLINQRNHLFRLKVQVVGEQTGPEELVEALGSEFMDNETDEPRLWEKVWPREGEELAWARNNLALLEHTTWGATLTDSRITRVRSLVTAIEAAGAFRLPIPPESGYLPGLLVRDEPFVQPPAVARQDEARVSLGEIVHRGNPTGVQFEIAARDLTRHALVAGSTGSGKTNTCLHLLGQLWKRHRVPFLVMYPIDKPDYRLLMADPEIASDLLIFTLGDDLTSPFRFNPFAVADGVLLKTHLSLLLRCFAAAFVLWDPLPAVFREALRRVYAEAGWDTLRGRGGPGAPATPTLAEFHETMIRVADELTRDYGPEARGNVRQGAVIRVGDLVQNLSHVLNIREAGPLDAVLRRPTVFELARAGSSEDVALVMGFLLMTLTQHVQSRYRQAPRDERKELHIMLVEEAHRLMAATGPSGQHTSDPRAKGAEDFGNILAEIRGFNEGLLVAEQIPTALVQGAIANTHFKIMHRLEDPGSFELFADVTNLDDRQRLFARSLPTGEVIVRAPGGEPTHVRVENYLDSFQSSTDEAVIDDSDEAVSRFMAGRVELPGLAPGRTETKPRPKWGEACKSCTVVCRHGELVAGLAVENLRDDARRVGPTMRGDQPAALSTLIHGRLAAVGLPNDVTLGYCYLARISASTTSDGRTNFERYPFIRSALTAYRQAHGIDPATAAL